MDKNFLEVEILKSERLRTTILALVFTLLSLMWTIFIAHSPEKYYKLMGEDTSVVIIPGYLGLIACYFFLVHKVINQYLNHKKTLPILIRYFNAFIEVSIPTLLIIIMMHYRIPLYILLMPPLLAYYVFIVLSALTLSERICLFSGIVAAIEYLSLSYYVLNYTDTSRIDPFLTAWYAFASRGMLLLIGGLVTAFITSRIKRQLFASYNAQKERERIESIFGQHVSPEVASRLLSKNANASEYLPACVMFLDVRNFTHFSEQNKPPVVVNYLNNFFEYAVEIIHSNKGIINKFLGDGFMAVFGAPISSGNDVANAVQAALAIIKCSEEEKKNNIFGLKLGIGLHFGYVIAGTIGTKRRLEYTVVGDAVNVTAHIEQLNKTYNSSILISEDAFKKLPETKAELIGSVALKHREKPMKIYRLV